MKRLILFIAQLVCCSSFTKVYSFSVIPVSSGNPEILVYPANLPAQIDNREDRNFMIAVTNTLMSNLFLLGFNRYILQAEYAQISFSSMRKNLNAEWVWDQDEFSVNHIGHPYQGSTYFISGRANGLDFYQSAFLTMGGSIFWELFCETETPSYNDLVATTLGGMAVGEMLHRIYIELYSNSPFISVLISPMNSFNSFITGTKPQPSNKVNISELALSFTSGSMLSHVKFNDDQRNDDENDKPLTIGAGLDVVYGKPFGLRARTPFSHFQFACDYLWARNYYSFTFFSDALLFSFSPFSNNVFKTSIGSSLHYDLIFSDLIQFSGNSIGASCKQQISLPGRNVIQWAFHLNWLVLGATDYYYFTSGKIDKPDSGEERRDYDLGTGQNIKISFAYSQPLAGTLSFSYIYIGMHTISNSVPREGSGGYTLIGIWDVSYERQLWENSWIGISNSFYHKNGFYRNATDISHRSDFMSLYIKTRF